MYTPVLALIEEEADLESEELRRLRTSTLASYFNIPTRPDTSPGTPQPPISATSSPKRPISSPSTSEPPAPSTLYSFNRISYIPSNPAAYTMPVLPRVSSMFSLTRPRSPSSAPQNPALESQKAAGPTPVVVDNGGSRFLDGPHSRPSSRPASPTHGNEQDDDSNCDGCEICVAQEKEEKEESEEMNKEIEREQEEEEIKAKERNEEIRREQEEEERRARERKEDIKREQEEEETRARERMEEIKREQEEEERRAKERSEKIKREQEEAKREAKERNERIKREQEEAEREAKERDEKIRMEQEEEERKEKERNEEIEKRQKEIEDANEKEQKEREKRRKTKLPWKKIHHGKGKYHERHSHDQRSQRRPSTSELDDGSLDKDGKSKSKLPWKRSHHHERHKSQGDIRDRDSDAKEFDKEGRKEEKEIEKDEKDIQKDQEKLEKNIRKEKRRQERESKRAKDAEDKQRAKEQRELEKQRKDYAKGLEKGEKEANKQQRQQFYADKTDLSTAPPPNVDVIPFNEGPNKYGGNGGTAPPPNVDVIPFDEGPNKYGDNGGSPDTSHTTQPPASFHLHGGPNKFRGKGGSEDTFHTAQPSSPVKKPTSLPEEKSRFNFFRRRRSPERKPGNERLGSETCESDTCTSTCSESSSDDATTEAGRTSSDSGRSVPSYQAPESIPLPASRTSLIPTRTSTDRYHVHDRKSEKCSVRLPIVADDPYPNGLQVPCRKLFSDGFRFPPGLKVYGITKREWEEMVHTFHNHVNPHRTWWATSILVFVFWPAAVGLAYPLKAWGEKHDFNRSVDHILRRVEDADAEIFRPRGLMLRMDKPGEVEGMAYMDMYHRHHIDRLPRAMMVPTKKHGVKTEFPQNLRQAARRAEEAEQRSILSHELEGRKIARQSSNRNESKVNRVTRKAAERRRRKRSVKHCQRAKERMARRPRLVIESLKSFEDGGRAEKHGWVDWYRRCQRRGTRLDYDVGTVLYSTMETCG